MYSSRYRRHAQRQILYAIGAPETLPALMAPFGNRETAYATRHLVLTTAALIADYRDYLQTLIVEGQTALKSADHETITFYQQQVQQAQTQLQYTDADLRAEAEKHYICGYGETLTDAGIVVFYNDNARYDTYTATASNQWAVTRDLMQYPMLKEKQGHYVNYDYLKNLDLSEPGYPSAILDATGWHDSGFSDAELAQRGPQCDHWFQTEVPQRLQTLQQAYPQTMLQLVYYQ
jgi:hypothetical protein